MKSDKFQTARPSRSKDKVSKEQTSQAFKDAQNYTKRFQKQVDAAKKKIKNLQTEIVRIQDGLYNKPLVPEMQEIYAYIYYMLTSSVAEAAVLSKINPNKINMWVREQRWDIERQMHYDTVKDQVKKHMQEEVADIQASIVTDIWGLVRRDISVVLENPEQASMTEQASAIKTLVETAMMLQGNDQQPADQPLRQLAQNLLVQFNTNNDNQLEKPNPHQLSSRTNNSEGLVEADYEITEEDLKLLEQDLASQDEFDIDEEHLGADKEDDGV